MAHYISYGSLDLRLHLDNPGNSRANTCILTPTFVEGVFLLAQNQLLPSGDVPLVIQSNLVRIAWPLCRRRIFQMSALSTCWLVKCQPRW